jgi:ribosome maturation factor rimM
MILDSDVFSIGRFTRTHGIHGEIEVHFTDDVFDRGEADYVFLKIDGLYVPFFLEDYRFKGSESALFTLDGIDSDTAARELVGHTVYYPLDARPAEDEDTISSLRAFTGFRLLIIDRQALAEMDEGGDETSEDGVPTLELGTVKHVETTTANTLLTVEVEGGEDVLLPLHDDFVVDYDLRERYLVLDVPEGLIDLND